MLFARSWLVLEGFVRQIAVKHASSLSTFSQLCWPLRAPFWQFFCKTKFRKCSFLPSTMFLDSVQNAFTTHTCPPWSFTIALHVGHLFLCEISMPVDPQKVATVRRECHTTSLTGNLCPTPAEIVKEIVFISLLRLVTDASGSALLDPVDTLHKRVSWNVSVSHLGTKTTRNSNCHDFKVLHLTDFYLMSTCLINGYPCKQLWVYLV